MRWLGEQERKYVGKHCGMKRSEGNLNYTI